MSGMIGKREKSVHPDLVARLFQRLLSEKCDAIPCDETDLCGSVDRFYLIYTIQFPELGKICVRFDEHDVSVLAGLIVDEAGSLLSRADARLYCGRLIVLVVG